MKSGFCAILGRPNVGKSTLLNALLSKKVSIVSPKPQTTRDQILGIYNEKGLQIVFIDTPGLFQSDEALDKAMNKAARSSLQDIDCLLYLIDASNEDYSEDETILAGIHTTKPWILAFNKIDLATAPMMEALTTHYRTLYPQAEQIQLSALTNFGLKEVKEAVASHLSEGPVYYPEEQISDKDHAFMAKEIVRQELLHFLKQEIPHQSAVYVSSFKEDKETAKINAVIYVEKETQKGIVIGHGGEMIKKISMSARHELERMWQKHVILVLDVEYSPNWRNDAAKLKKLGYGVKDDEDAE
jgi:GTP-binding protein Era